jgi:hypothetical protein
LQQQAKERRREERIQGLQNQRNGLGPLLPRQPRPRL